MKSISKFALAASIGLAIALTFSCSSDDGDEGCNVEGGTLKGCTWERSSKSTSSIASWDLTYILKFTSDEKVTRTRTGWEETNTITGGKKRDNINDKFDYTYAYVPTNRLGAAERISNGNKVLFNVSADYKSLTWDGNKYSKK